MSQNHSGVGLAAEEGVLSLAAGKVSQTRSDVTGLCLQLDGQIEDLRAKWGGEGARAFSQLHAGWQDKQRRIVGALDTLAASLQDTDRDNTATDHAQAETSMSLASRLG